MSVLHVLSYKTDELKMHFILTDLVKLLLKVFFHLESALK